MHILNKKLYYFFLYIEHIILFYYYFSSVFFTYFCYTVTPQLSVGPDFLVFEKVKKTDKEIKKFSILSYIIKDMKFFKFLSLITK